MAKGLKIEIKGIHAFDGSEEHLHSAICDAMDVIRMDLVRTSSGLAPVKEGILENSYTEKTSNTNTKAEFSISYAAFNDGFNYAEWTHNREYKLGEKSAKKRPAKSRFANKSFKVGKNYLFGVADACKDGYGNFITKYVNKELKKHLKKNNGK